ncbi:MAG: hypothetical protein ACLR4Z_00440 [Butyricicoccaceae bacterium]
MMDLICPSAIDMTHRDYLVIDGVYHAYLYIAGYGYQSLVRGGWLAVLVGMGDGISLSTTSFAVCARRYCRKSQTPRFGAAVVCAM